jgi:mycothiol synthase
VLGVRPRWRRRGLARALLLHAFSEFRARGKHGAGLGVDGLNLTGAVALYEGVGMHVARRFDQYAKPLAT